MCQHVSAYVSIRQQVLVLLCTRMTHFSSERYSPSRDCVVRDQDSEVHLALCSVLDFVAEGRSLGPRVKMLVLRVEG